MTSGRAGVCAPSGFRAAGVAAGIKSSGALDLALVVNDGPCQSAAAVLTANRVQAAPVKWTATAVADGLLHAVVLNSGGANACTGAAGDADALRTATAVAATLECAVEQVAVCSTGLIGVRLPMAEVAVGVETASAELSPDHGEEAATAIMTTDTRSKTAAVERHGVVIGGMAKGAGMLAPGLATMLCVLTTDATVEPSELDVALRTATGLSFDRVDSDGCMSTNDTVIAMASGASGRTVGVDLSVDDFTEALSEVCRDLAMQLLGDAEGASKQIEVLVRGAAHDADALEVGRAVARSNLFKCAVHGEDPNWGRVLAAVGTTAAAFEPDELSVEMNGVLLAAQGAAVDPVPDVDLSDEWVQVVVDLGAGPASASVWTNDLTADYVHENSAYSS